MLCCTYCCIFHCLMISLSFHHVNLLKRLRRVTWRNIIVKGGPGGPSFDVVPFLGRSSHSNDEASGPIGEPAEPADDADLRCRGKRCPYIRHKISSQCHVQWLEGLGLELGLDMKLDLTCPGPKETRLSFCQDCWCKISNCVVNVMTYWDVPCY